MIVFTLMHLPCVSTLAVKGPAAHAGAADGLRRNEALAARGENEGSRAGRGAWLAYRSIRC